MEWRWTRETFIEKVVNEKVSRQTHGRCLLIGKPWMAFENELSVDLKSYLVSIRLGILIRESVLFIGFGFC